MRTKEGGYQRTGSRSPMQWSHAKNMGFSNAPAQELYLPLDGAEDAPCVADQLGDANSLLAEVRRLTTLRHAYEDLQADAPFAVVNDDERAAPFVYRRGSLFLAINPSSQAKRYESDLLCGKELIYQIGETGICDERLTMMGQSFAVLA